MSLKHDAIQQQQQQDADPIEWHRQQQHDNAARCAECGRYAVVVGGGGDEAGPYLELRCSLHGVVRQRD